jgi:hypothetical protein
MYVGKEKSKSKKSSTIFGKAKTCERLHLRFASPLLCYYLQLIKNDVMFRSSLKFAQAAQYISRKEFLEALADVYPSAASARRHGPQRLGINTQDSAENHKRH